jgi:hypothetical protein
MPTKTTTPAEAPPAAPTDPRLATHFPGIADRDIALVERVATDLATLARALRKGDSKAAQAVYANLLKLPREAERIRFVARRAFARRE